ncbi:jerky protein homolog-like [Myzus persicae]|uniref:jerky protein homolog-like n=1 Tax=Myzus persicae TaxID=13164 RepID=UPI000B930DFC|nr:jerky protein homolog-like [Myzus persicae]
MTQREASAHFKIPRSTIKNKLKKKHGKNIGRPTTFSTAEETSFAQHCTKLADFGFPLIPADLKLSIKTYLDSKGVRVSRFKNNTPGDDWVSGFLKRHPELSVKVSSNIKKSRAKITADDINDYMDRLEKNLAGIPPSRIYNYDETNLTDDTGNKKVLCKRGTKYVEQICNSTKSAISLMFCGNAEGHLIPNYVVYKAEALWTTWTEGGPPNTRYNRSKSGWFDTNIFQNWFESTFLKEVQGGGPCALIGDNLASHINERVIEICEAHDIKFICLPPNTTHITQPLDIAFFRPMKGAWRNILREWKKTKIGSCFTTLPKDLFPRLLTKLMEKIDMNKAENLKSGFIKAGIYPLNRQKLLDRLAENKGEMFDQDLIGNAFLCRIQKEREDFIGVGEKQRKKKLQVSPGDSISVEEIRKSRGNPGPSNETPQPKKKLKYAELPSSSESDIDGIDTLLSDSDDVDLDPDSDSEDVDNLDLAVAEAEEEQQASNYNVGDFVIVQFENKNFPGRIISIFDKGAKVDCMEKLSKQWRWPSKKDCIDYEWSDIIRKIQPPLLCKRNFFRVPDLEDFV